MALTSSWARPRKLVRSASCRTISSWWVFSASLKSWAAARREGEQDAETGAAGDPSRREVDHRRQAGGHDRPILRGLVGASLRHRHRSRRPGSPTPRAPRPGASVVDWAAAASSRSRRVAHGRGRRPRPGRSGDGSGFGGYASAASSSCGNSPVEGAGGRGPADQQHGEGREQHHHQRCPAAPVRLLRHLMTVPSQQSLLHECTEVRRLSK